MGERSNGLLTPTERFRFLRNMAFLATREVTDVIRTKIGLLKPVKSQSFLTWPRRTRAWSKMQKSMRAPPIHKTYCRTATARITSAPCLLRIVSQIYREAHFAAALLHDIGLTESRITPLKQCCFAVSGGRQARDFLRSKDHPAAKAQVVGEAISAHLNLHVPVESTARSRHWWRKGPSATCLALRKQAARTFQK